MHTLGIVVVLFALIPVAYAGWARIAPMRLIVFAVIAGVLGRLYYMFVVMPPYQAWITKNHSLADEISTAEEKSSLVDILAGIPSFVIFNMLIGVFAGLWMARKCDARDDKSGALLRTLGLYLFAGITGLFAGLGYIYGAVLSAILFLLLKPEGIVTIFRQAMIPIILLFVVSMVSVLGIFIDEGSSGVKALLLFPFPYPIYLAQATGVVFFIIFIMTSLLLVIRKPNSSDIVIRAFLVVIISLVLAIGIVSAWGGVRYLLVVYPFIILVTVYGLNLLVTTLCNRYAFMTELSSLIILVTISISGVLGGHGIMKAIEMATLKHGDPINKTIFSYPVYPDHKSAGEYVKRNRSPHDIIIAEDTIQQRWYVGHVDYWLRNPATHSGFTYTTPDDVMKDIYVGSVMLDGNALNQISSNPSKVIWVITSAETDHKRDYYLSQQQVDWLTKIERSIKPVFIARDGITKVYCLNCQHADK
jgi:hypothetical protein